MGEFADKLAAQSPAFQRAYLGSLAPNLVKSGKLEKYYQTLTNFDYMVAKINHPEFGVLKKGKILLLSKLILAL